MAGCCPSIPPSAAIGAAFAEAYGPESDIRPGESVECYMARGGNTTGLHDDATENVANKIENTNIATTTFSVGSVKQVKFDAIQFRLTESSTRTPTSWVWQHAGGEPLTVLGASVTFSVAGVLDGVISSNAYEKTFTVKVVASDATGEIDSRSFTFVPSIKSEMAIKFISPLPGGIVNSRFGPRLHPIHKVMKPHTGIDMKYQDGSVKNVVAAADGEVILAGGNPSSGYGLRVWVKHKTNDGTHICTTTYNHLAKIYVKEGQKVMAGQSLGLEGSTGGSTGNHLHFECRLADGKFVDPEPLINGELKVARRTLDNGEADPSSLEVKNSAAALSAAEAKAKQSSCAAYGPGYPADPNETNNVIPPAPTPSTDPFELAWFFTMTHEVGPWWNASYPNDPDVIAGSIDTALQRKKCGYVNTRNYPGGETKFGIAQKPNPSISVTNLNYADAKKRGYNGYWKSAKISCDGKGPYIAVMLFDMNYMHGDGNARKIWENAISAGMNPNISGRDAQLTQCEILNEARVEFIKSIPRPEYTKGWLKRAKDCLTYIKSLPVL